MERIYSLKRICLLTALVVVYFLSSAHRPDKRPRLNDNGEQILPVSLRADCATSRSAFDMSINNVRARLLGGGDVWWDLSDGKYIVPKVDPASGQQEVSSIFAGAVWLGGYDPVGNLKLAAQSYRTGNANDFWPGPLDPFEGTIETSVCEQWDKHFQVLGTNIAAHLANYSKAIQAGTDYDCESIPEDVLGWPARGNPYFEEIHGFKLPNTTQGLAAFYDQDGNGQYDPCVGDYPVIEIRGCTVPQYPDEMIFWIYNDAGGIHTQTQGQPIQMEVQVQAFAYATNDEINDMTFQRYKLINRATTSIDSTFFAMWVDPDLGCFTDDYIGCDTSRSLAYVYNEDVLDGETGCDCPLGVATYCDEVPILGVDYFRGPLDEDGNEIGMSSFTYYNNQAVGNWPNAMTDPQVAQEYYNYMSGSWKDGTPFTYGGTGFQIGGSPIDYAFTEPPNDVNGWSMCTSNLDFGDRRTIQASGPFRLDPGAVNELIVGVVWVPDMAYPCPDIERLLSADDIAQALFDNCFDITDGPDAPDVDIVELDQELILILSNDTLTSNNAYEAYAELDLQAPAGIDDSLYVFEGYKVFQLINSEVSVGELDNIDKSRLVFQADNKNGINTIYNWKSIPDPGSPEPIWIPEIEVEGMDQGIQHTFRITEDQFATDDRTLVNHKAYYFLALAYAHNNYEQFDPRDVVGQRRPYLEGRRNIQKYEGIPRPIIFQNLNANYGDGATITRTDGIGAGGNFLDMSDETNASILDGSFTGAIKYKPGQGPLDVQIYNPLDVVDGVFRLTFVDDIMSNQALDPGTRWVLTELSNPDRPIFAEASIDRLNEQVIAEYGFSISIGQTNDVGDQSDGMSGTIGASFEYVEGDLDPWFLGIPDDAGGPLYNYMKTSNGEFDFSRDPDQTFKSFAGGAFVPFVLTDFRRPTDQLPYISPAWHDGAQSFDIVRQRNPISNLNNVDVVFTSNKALWSRCVVVETATPFITSNTWGIGVPAQGEHRNFDLRSSPSVGRDDNNGDGLADPDGDGIGMGWFPGYAIDVETGKRLNIFFGENSTYDGRFLSDLFEGGARGGDMMWNPTDQVFLDTGGDISLYNFYLGGHHFIYVTNEEYDGCTLLRERMDPGIGDLKKITSLQNITWTSVPMTLPSTSLLSYQDGLIPNDLTVKLRVDNPYAVEVGTNTYSGYPTYEFEFSGNESEEISGDQIPEALKKINVVPNPYYGFSSYETSQFTNTVKITNLPAKCKVTIFSLDGKFIRQYQRDEVRVPFSGRSNPSIPSNQISPDLEWDLENSRGIPVASGVYLIQVDAPGLGSRVLKWFGVSRQFDPSGL